MVGVEPTCQFPDKRISSASRYDHFDTSPLDFLFNDFFLEFHINIKYLLSL